MKLRPTYVLVCALLLSVNGAWAQSGHPLVANPGNNGGNTATTGNNDFKREPLFKPSRFSDIAPGFPKNQFIKPLSQPIYDYGKHVHFGFIFAFSTIDYVITSSPNTQYSSKDPSRGYNYFVDVSSLSPTLGVAALMDVRISHNLSFRMQLGPSFGDAIINFYENNQLSHQMRIESVLLEMPLLLKYKARREVDFRPYMIGGITPYSDIAAFKSLNENKGIFIGIRPFDVAATLGVGFDVYADFFKFSLEFKYSRGMISQVSSEYLEGYEQYPNAIKKMYQQSFVLSVIFE
ncbi:MAG: PorT family protein [Prevotellaceae bacterium]|nr:PorT family protein [Prevotellaceae bacterium]